MLEIDDVLEFGDEDHRSLMEALEQEIKFGKRVKLKDSNEGIFFAGRRLRQKEDSSFLVDMEEFIHKRLDEVKLEKRKHAASEHPEKIVVELTTPKRLTFTTELPADYFSSDVQER
jgi:hypothetical protein